MNKEKEDLFHKLFEKKVRIVDERKENKNVSTSLETTEIEIEKHMNSLYKKYKHLIRSKDDFKSEYIFLAYESIERFEIECFDEWQKMLNDEAPFLMNRIIKNIKVTTEFDIHKYANERDTKRTTGELNGKKQQHIIKKINLDSLESLMSNNDEESFSSNEDFTSDENSLFFQVDQSEYEESDFSGWFKKNKHVILTKSQLEFLKNLDKCRKVEGYTINDVEKYTGTASHKVNERLARIQKRIFRAWLENDKVARNRLEVTRDNQIRVLQQYKDIADDDRRLDEQNELLSNWIKKNFNKNFVMDILDEILAGEDMKLTNRALQTNEGMIPSSVLFDFLMAVEEKLDRLNQMNCEVKTFKKKKKRTAQTSKNSIVKTYKNGSLVNVEIDKKKEKKKNIVYILPNGYELATDGETW